MNQLLQLALVLYVGCCELVVGHFNLGNFLPRSLLVNGTSNSSNSSNATNDFTANYIQFNDQGTLLYVTFSENVETATAGMANTFIDCSDLFDDTSDVKLGSSLCGFDSSDNKTMIIELASDASIVPNTDSLTLESYVFLSHDSGNGNEGATLTVNEPNSYPDTSLDISYPSQIGACDGLTLDGENSVGLTYSASFVWNVVITLESDGSTDSSNYYTDEPNLLLTSNELESGDIEITVTVTTALGTSDSMVLNIEKLSLGSVDVSINGITKDSNGNADWIAGKTLILFADIDGSTCDNDDSNDDSSDYNITWIFDDSTVESNAIRQANQLIIPSGTFSIMRVYTIGVIVNPESTSLLNGEDSVTISIFTSDYDLVAKIEGGFFQTQLIANSLTLDAETLSYDYQESDGSTDDLSFSWTCDVVDDDNNGRRRLAMDNYTNNTYEFSTSEVTVSCPDLDGINGESKMTIDANSLSDNGLYLFTVTMSDNSGFRSDATDSVYVVASTKGSSLMIWTKSHVIDATEQLKLYGIGTTQSGHDYAEILVYSWNETSSLITDFSSNNGISGISESTLVIDANVLTPGETYIFTLTTTTLDVLQSTASVQNSAAIEIKPHVGPIVESISVTPNTGGITLETQYEIDVNCTGDYKPFTYSYYWRYDDTDSSENNLIFEESGANSIDGIYLPAGDLVLTVECNDLYGVSDSSEIAILVNELFDSSSSLTSNETDSFISAVLSALNSAVSELDYSGLIGVIEVAIESIELYRNSLSDDNIDELMDAFYSSLETVIQEMDLCDEDTTSLQAVLTGMVNIDTELSDTNIVTLSYLLLNAYELECDDDGSNGTFSDILSPENVFEEAMSDSEISTRKGLIDAVLDSSYSNSSNLDIFCINIRYSQVALFNLLQTIVSTNLPNDALTSLDDSSNNNHYSAKARRVSPGTGIDWTMADDDTNIVIPSNATSGGRSLFANYDSPFDLDSVDVFVIQWSNALLQLCDGLYVIPQIYESDNEDDECGVLFSDALRVEIDTDNDLNNLGESIVMTFVKDSEITSCDDLSDNNDTSSDDTDESEDSSTTTTKIISTTSCSYFSEGSAYDDIDNEWSSDSSCILTYDSATSLYTCACDHATTFAVTSIMETKIIKDEIGILVYYVILGGFIFFGVLCGIFMLCILLKDLCKLESVVMIYYLVFTISWYEAAMCIYLAVNDSFVLLDIIGAALHYILLAIVLNSWSRLSRGVEKGHRACERILLNLSSIVVILYVCAVAVLSFLENSDYDWIMEFANVGVFGLSGLFSLLWLVWRPFACFGIKICKSDDITETGQRGIRRLFWVLLIMCIGFIIESILVVYFNSDYLSFLSSLIESISYINGDQEEWRFVNYCIDLLILLVVLTFYIPITWHAIRYIPRRQSTFTSRFGQSVGNHSLAMEDSIGRHHGNHGKHGHHSPQPQPRQYQSAPPQSRASYYGAPGPHGSMGPAAAQSVGYPGLGPPHGVPHGGPPQGVPPPQSGGPPVAFGGPNQPFAPHFKPPPPNGAPPSDARRWY